jgi:hypothetical protein
VNRIAYLASLATAAPLLGCGPLDGLADEDSVLTGTPSPEDRPPSGWFVRIIGALVVALAAALLGNPSR